MNLLLILLGKAIMLFSKTFNLGSGSTWPGHIALSVNKNFIKEVINNNQTPPRHSGKSERSEDASRISNGNKRSWTNQDDRNHNLKVIFIAGTNGKTTTTTLIRAILEKNGKKVFQNQSGANLLSGLASTLIEYVSLNGTLNFDYALFEIDENTLPLAIAEIVPNYVVLLNLFRDQLDRYGEVHSIADKWHSAMQNLPSSTIVLLNADDPQIAYLGSSVIATPSSPREKQSRPKEIAASQAPRNDKPIFLYFGMNNKSLADKKPQHASDSLYCPTCGHKLTYSLTFYSHLGIWKCLKCGAKRPELDISQTSIYPLPGIYNKYNTLAAVLLVKALGLNEHQVQKGMKDFKPAFGRQEIIEIGNKKAQLFLSKNPTSFNQSLRAITELKAKNLLIVLNDRVPDGHDVSWIWDADFEDYVEQFDLITISGDRCYDMALRVKYARETQNSKVKTQNYSSKVKIEPTLDVAVQESIQQTPEHDTLYILPTYSAMLEVRKILTGKKIL